MKIRTLFAAEPCQGKTPSWEAARQRHSVGAFFAAATLGVAALAQMSVAAGADTSPDQPKQSVGEYASDALITTKVKAAFVAEQNLSALEIAVETQDGVVRLSGEVDTAEQSDQATQVARGIDGVKDVENLIKVKAQ